MAPTPTMAAALQLVHDVLADRGPTPDGGAFRMCAVRSDKRPAHRRVLVARFGHMVPVGTTTADAPRVAADIVATWHGGT